MDRKKFLKSSALTAFGVSIFGNIKATDNKQFVGDCNTTNDILGPFYQPNAPITDNLIKKQYKGTPVVVKGIVCKPDCKTPLLDAMVEVWQCDSDGEYDNKAFDLRGRQYTDEEGRYSFQTILPGKYLNGRLYRPAHIHFRVTAPGYKELISQIYFAGDPHIEEDPWASADKATLRVLNIFPDDVNSNLSVEFNIYLAYA